MCCWFFRRISNSFFFRILVNVRILLKKIFAVYWFGIGWGSRMWATHVHIRLILNDNDYKTQMLCVADRSVYSVLFDAKSPTVINLYVMCAQTVLTHSVCIYIYSLFRFLHRFNRKCVCVYACANLCILYDTWWYVCFMVLWLAVKYTQIYNHQLNKRNNLADFACT